MEYGHGRGGIDRDRRERRPGVPGADEALERLRLIVRLDPGPHRQRVALSNPALEGCLVGHQDIRTAVGQNTAHLGEREHWIERPRDAPYFVRQRYGYPGDRQG